MRLYTACQRRLYIYLLSLVHNVSDAEELLQQTSFVLWQKFAEFQPGSNFGAWACRIAYLETCKLLESRRERSLSPAFLERVAEKMSQASELLELHGDVFRYCLERLNEADRQLIIRRYAPGMNVRTLALELNRPARSVSKSLTRIRRTLLECIERRLRQEERE